MVGNDVTTGELDRRMRDHEDRTLRDHQTIHDRISRVSMNSVQNAVHDQIERERTDQIKDLDDRLTAIESKRGLTKTQIIAICGVIVALAALLVQTYMATKGSK